jgi:pantothenate kinase
MSVAEGHTEDPASPAGPEPLFGPQSLAELATRALGLAAAGRAVLGIVGEPGAGKSTFAEQLLAAVEARRPGTAVAVSMDGFHLAQRVLDSRGQAAVKGAIETFDADGFLALLRRTAVETGHTVWWPEFRRHIEEPVAGAVGVLPGTRLVIVDGNFLLDTDPPWGGVRALLTEAWFLDADGSRRQQRLAGRYVRYGFTEQAAWAKVLGVDEQNSARVRRHAERADLTLPERPERPHSLRNGHH